MSGSRSASTGHPAMEVEVVDGGEALSRRVAERVADAVRVDVAERGRCVLAFSGGSTPAAALDRLAAVDLPWDRVHVAQVDERVAPDGRADRNWTMLTERLLDTAPLPAANAHPMPVTAEDLGSAAARYAAELAELCGRPPVLDLVHLGLGEDGHTASLVPGDAALDEATADVAVAGPYQGRRRMTLTFPAINRARRILWQVAGAGKAAALRQALQGDGVPGSRVRRDAAVAVVERAAAAELGNRS